MGGNGKSMVVLSASAASISDPVQKSVVSESFDGRATAEQVFDAFLIWQKEGRSPDGNAPKSVEILDEKEGEFTVVATWNGTLCRAVARLHKLENVPKTGDYVLKKTVKYDRASLTITEETLAGSISDLQLLMTATTTVHKSPAVIEWYAMDKTGTRHFDASAAKPVQGVIDNVFARLEKDKAPCGGA